MNRQHDRIDAQGNLERTETVGPIALSREPCRIVVLTKGAKLTTGLAYRGIRTKSESVIWAPQWIPLPLRLDLFNHSPDGFGWGNGTAPAAQTALAVLAHALDDDRMAVRYHQKFKWYAFSEVRGDRWELTLDALRHALGQIGAESDRLKGDPA